MDLCVKRVKEEESINKVYNEAFAISTIVHFCWASRPTFTWFLHSTDTIETKYHRSIQ